jgi:putative ABC transport system permease protein
MTMRPFSGILRSLFGSKRLEDEVSEELAFHIEKETEENRRRGLDPEEARRAAVIRFGGIEKTKEESREVRRAYWLDTTLQDVRYGLRSLRQSPGFAIAAVLTLALGIGANAAIFSVVHGVLMQSLPYGGGDRLVRIRVDAPGAGISDGQFSVPELEDLRAMTRSFDGIVEYHSMWFVLLGHGEPERVQTGVVSANYFDMLGVRPMVGRTFLPGEDRRGAAPVLVLSHDYWMRSFGGDPSVVGRVFRMNDHAHTVVGVLPPIPGYPQDNDVYMPVSACPFRSDPMMETMRDGGMLKLFARRRAGASLSAARSDLEAAAARMAHDHPESYPASVRFSVSPVPLSEELTRQARPTFLLLFGTVGLVLLLACANVANLSLARLARREKEMAVRSALGAGRARLTRQLVTESLLVAVAGGIVGVAVAAAGHGLLVHFAERFTPRAGEIAIDAPVLIFSLVVSVLVGIVLGLGPAFSRRLDLRTALQDGRSDAASAPGGHRTRSLLIVGQVAISFVLLAGAGLMLRTVWKLAGVDPGFRTERVLTSRLDLNFTRYKTAEDRRQFCSRLLDRLGAEPGIVAVALAGSFPLNERGPANGRFRIEGQPPAAPQSLPRADFQRVSADYFRTIGIPILSGRALSSQDRKDTLPVAVVNRTMAAHFWPGENPVGRRIGVDGDEPGQVVWLTIVGVSGDVRQYRLAQPPGDQVYVSLLQYPGLSTTCLVRTAIDPKRMEGAVRAAVHAIGPEQPVDHFRTLDEVRAGALASPRLTATLLLLFAGLALTITATGIVGVIGFSVGQRRQEFGIRMALGALPGTVRAMVLRQGLRLVMIGLAIGLAGALVLTRLWASLLFEVSPTDPPTFFVVALLLLAVAVAACVVPARRATAVDPMVALRSA